MYTSVIIYSKSNNKEKTIKWKEAGDFVYGILYQVIYRSVYRFLNVLYFVGGKYDFNNIGSNYDFTVQIRQ